MTTIYCRYEECTQETSVTILTIPSRVSGEKLVYDQDPPHPWERGPDGLWICGHHYLGVDKTFRPGLNRIFVFGANLAGRHGAGAAKAALNLYGAVYGQGEGLQGLSYAIPTKDKSLNTLPLDVIAGHAQAFLDTAAYHPHLHFFVTRIGCGLAGYRDEQIGPLFRHAPNNCELPYGWRQ